MKRLLHLVLLVFAMALSGSVVAMPLGLRTSMWYVLESAPAPFPDGGPYKESVDGVEITFEVVNGESWIGSSEYDQGVPDTTTGDVRVPATLGGHAVVGIRAFAFFRCKDIAALIFEGDEPTVDSGAFNNANIGKVYVTRFANWPKPLPATWQGFPISYIAAMNPELYVTASRTSGTFSGSITLSLSAGTGRTIYYTIDGTEPTQSSSVYSSPLAISTTMTVKFFAVDNETGDWGPVPSVTLTRVASESADIVVTPSVPDGTRFVGSQYVILNAGSGKTIYYTTDGSDPMTSPTRMQYTDSIYMSAKTTLKYYAVDNTYGDWSPVQTATYTLRKGDGAYTEVVGGLEWSYVISNGCAIVGKRTSYNTSSGVNYSWTAAIPTTTAGAVVVPSELGGCPVASIGSCAFCWCGSLTSVTIPDSVTDIGAGAFNGCSELQSVHITYVAAWCRITFSDSGSNPLYNAKAGLYINGSLVTNLVIPDGVTSIRNDAFCYCRSLTSVTIPDGVTSIGNNAFSSCIALTSVTIPDSVMSIGNNAFGSCGILQRVIMEGDAPESVGNYVFSGVSSLCCVYVHKGSTGWGVSIPGVWNGVSIKYLEDSALVEEVNGLPWTVISDGAATRLVPAAGDLSLRDIVKGNVVVPETINGKPVTTIGKGLFQGASEVTSVVLPATITEIESSAFRECSRLEGIELPDGLAEIGDNAFRECVSLRNITIPATVTNIGCFAFRDCLRLETVNLLGDPPRRDLGVFMGVPAFTTISGRLGATTAVIYATVTNSTPEITVPDGWLDEIALAHDTPAGAASYQAAFVAKFGSDLSEALKKPTGKYDLKGNPLYVWQDYVAGTDPLDEEDKFTATITMEGGVPIVKWSPELPAGKAVLRKYTTYGATALGGEWVDVSDLTDAERHAAGYQFFQVSVEMQ